MIRVLLSGGLGNQLFQYAYAKALATRSGGSLLLDTVTLFQTDRVYKRIFDLGEFRLGQNVKKTDSRLRWWWIRRRLLERHGSCRQLARRRLVIEPAPYRFRSEYSRLKPELSTLVCGYWQSPKYFEEIASPLRDDLTFTSDPDPKIAEISKQISSEESVGVHVRRIQYPTLLDSSYHRNAMNTLAENIDRPKFYVFGDDLDWWLREFGKREEVSFPSSGSRLAIDDFRLMSMCKHFIIANSSFSWWAAWLGSHSEKRVIMPSKPYWDQPELYYTGWPQSARD